MPVSVILAAVAVAVALPLLLWALSAGSATTAGVSRNLSPDRPVANLRQIILTRPASDRALRPLAYAIARRTRRLTPTGAVEAMERRIELAGEARPVERLLLQKVVMGVILGAAGVWFFLAERNFNSALLAGFAIVVGFTLPDAALARSARTRQESIRRDLPDVLDQLSVCVEAGLGLDAALLRVAQTGHGPLAEELNRTLQDVRLGMSRHDAFRRLVDRNDVPELRQFIHAVLQAETYGVPTVNVLRAQSLEQRERRRFRAEERAMKIPVKLVFPLVLCILPTLLLVVLGPGLTQALDNL